MKYLSKAIRLERPESVKRELHRSEVNILIASSDCEYAVQGGRLETRAMNYEAKLLKKIRLEVTANDDFLQPTIEAIKRGSISNERKKGWKR